MASSLLPALSHGFLTRMSARIPYSSFKGSFSDDGLSGFTQHVSSILSNTQRRAMMLPGKAYATATVVRENEIYTLPRWTDFEMGLQPVFWETQTGKPPTCGEEVTIFFNPSCSKLVPNMEYGIGFNGGFNQPIMCGGEPRIMTRRERGTNCAPFFTIKINVPLHALTLEFSFTDGKDWDGPYKLEFQIPKKMRGKPIELYNEELAKELSGDGACEHAIYPDAAFIEDRCMFPASLIHEEGNRCDLDIVSGCMDPDSPLYDPFATVDDGSCPYISDESSDGE